MPSLIETNIQNGVIYIPPKKEFTVEKGIGETVFETMKKHSDIIAQINPETNEKQTYASLLSKSIRTAQNLRRKGIRPDDMVAICSLNNMNYTSTVLGSFFIGAVNALLDPFTSLADITHCIKLTTPKIVFCDEDLENTVEKALENIGITAEIVVFGITEKNVPFAEYLIEQEPEENFEVHEIKDVSSTVCIHFSSGTTGLPKGVCVTHYGLLQGAFHFKGDYMYVQTSIIVTSPFWISNMNSIVANLISGDTRIVLKKLDESAVMKYVQDYKINCITISPTNGSVLIKHPEYYKNYDLSCLIVVGTGGSPTAPKQFLEYTKMFPKSKIVSGYGMTETGGHIFNVALQNAAEVVESNHNFVGTPIPGFKYKIVNPDTEELLGPNEEGELRVKFKGMMSAYYNNPKAFADSFDKDGYLKTGDILFFDEKLRFFYVSRFKDNFKFQVWQICPAQVESELIKHPNVRQCVVFGVPHETDIEHCTAVVAVDDKSKYDEKEMIEFTNSRMVDRYHIRGGIYLLDTIPVTSTGKIQRKKLQELVQKLKNKV